MRCKICNEESTGEYCRVHDMAMKNLKETYKTWKKAMDIDWEKYLDAVRQNKNSGEWVVELCKQYNVRELLVEANGPGDVMFEQIKKQYSRATPLFQTNDTKSNIIRRLMGDIEDVNIELPSPKLYPELSDELEIFQYEVLPSGKIRYSHPSGFHDDIVISLAMANWSRVNPKRGGKISISSVR